MCVCVKFKTEFAAYVQDDCCCCCCCRRLCKNSDILLGLNCKIDAVMKDNQKIQRYECFQERKSSSAVSEDNNEMLFEQFYGGFFILFIFLKKGSMHAGTFLCESLCVRFVCLCLFL